LIRALARHAVIKLPRNVRRLIAICLVLTTGVGGWYAYAIGRWRSATRAAAERRWTDARDHARFCVRVWPSDVRVRLLAARAARSLGDFETAERLLNECNKLQSESSQAVQIEFLLMRAQTGEVDEVAPILMELVQADHPDAALMLETITRAYLHNLRYAPALATLDRWIEAAPEVAEPHRLRGWLLERVNKADEAVKSYERALELDPELIPARLSIVEILLGRSSAPEALPHLELLRKQAPQRPDVTARLGQCKLLFGEMDEARTLMETALPRIPKDAPLLVALARLEMSAGNPAKAEEYLTRILKADPADVEAQFMLVSALQLQGRQKEAKAARQRYDQVKALLERANRLLEGEAANPTTDPETVFDLGASLLRIGHARLGLYWLHEALARAPDYEPAHRALADYYAGVGDETRAAVHRRRLAVPKQP
jgi:tetratricopeptide (TPR) repeat protein